MTFSLCPDSTRRDSTLRDSTLPDSERWFLGLLERDEVCNQNGTPIAYIVPQGDGRATRLLVAAPQMREALGHDPSGRPFYDLLRLAADLIPTTPKSSALADCLRSKADQVAAALASALGSDPKDPDPATPQAVRREIEALLELSVVTSGEARRLKESLTPSVVEHYLSDGLTIRELVDMQRDLIR